MMEWWESLRDQLKVEVSTEVSQVTDKDSSVEVSFIVTNGSSPGSVDYPKIVYEQLQLTIDTPQGSHNVDLGSLSPQECVTHTEEMPYRELIDMEYHLAGTVSPTAFLTVRREGTQGEAVGMSVEAYLQLFDELSIHGWLDSTVKCFPVPGPETTLGEFGQLREPLRDAREQIAETQLRLQHLVSRVTGGQHREVLQHRGVVEVYLQETIRELGHIERALESHNPMSISDTVSSVAERLDTAAARVNEATTGLSKWNQ